ncbi:MAG: hypothetical protein Q4P16_11690 [Spirochaetales bacterium]|nr:hypothetical protein [Spirochaetales bacterium]
MSFTFRHSAGFGKRIEYYIIGLMLKEGLDCYVPLVDDDGIDCVIRQDNGHFIEVQIKARSNDVKMGDAALFAALEHEKRENYFFVFYSERLQKKWIMSSEEFLKECVTNKTGKNSGKRSIWFNGCKTDENGEKKEYPKDKFNKYLAEDFSRFKNID